MKKIIIAFLLSFFAITAKAASLNIVALVNGEIISNEDIENRVNLFVMNTNIPLNPQTENMVRNKVLHSAIDERLKLQDAEKLGLKIGEQEVSAAIVNFEKNSKLNTGDLYNMLKQHKVSEETFRSQIRSDLAWVKVVRRRMAGDNTVSQKEIEQALEDAKKDLATPKYMVAEIFIRKGNAQDVEGLVAKIKEDPRFELYAMQFSESPSASSGGNLGWVNKGKFIPQLEAALSKMTPGEISDPIRVNGDYYILRLNNTFNPAKDKTPEPKEENIRAWLENKKMEEFAASHLQKLRQTAVIEIKQ